MRKVLIGLAVVLGVAFVAGYVYREDLKAAAIDRVTADMFVDSDTDTYDPGVAVGQQLPPLRALWNGRELTSVGELMGKRGLLLFVNRSVDW
jgi:hypothetical protein